MKFRFIDLIHYNVILRLFRSNIRKSIRGYSFLKKHNRLSLLSSIHSQLHELDLSPYSSQLSPVLFGNYLPKASICLRQYLVLRLSSLKINSTILSLVSGKTSICFSPLPFFYTDILQKNNIVVNQIIPGIIWWMFMLFHLLWGFSLFIRTNADFIGSLFKSSSKYKCNYTYYHSIVPEVLVSTPSSEGVYSLLDWHNKVLSQTCKTVFAHSLFGSESSIGSSLFLESVIPPITLKKYYRV